MDPQSIALPTELTQSTVECGIRTRDWFVALTTELPFKGRESNPRHTNVVENNARLSSIRLLNEHRTVRPLETYTPLGSFVFSALLPLKARQRFLSVRLTELLSERDESNIQGIVHHFYRVARFQLRSTLRYELG